MFLALESEDSAQTIPLIKGIPMLENLVDSYKNLSLLKPEK